MLKHEYLATSEEANGEPALIVIKEGPFENVEYRYGQVSIEEPKEDDEDCLLTFTYEVVKNPNGEPNELEELDDFKQTIGKLLVDIISDHVEQEA